MRGRKKLPANLHVIRGNPSRRPIKEAPEPATDKVAAPSHLEGHALEEWNRILPELKALDIISNVDTAALAAYCIAYGRWRTAEEAIAKMAANDKLTHGLMIKTTNGNAIQNPLVGTSNKAQSDMVRYAAEFGMTPSARNRISSGSGEKKDPADAFFT